MRILLAIAATSLLVSQYAGAQPPAPTPPLALPGLECYEHLTMPEYPISALQSRVDGSVWTRVEVNPQGMAGKINTQVVSAWSNGASLLTPPVEAAIHASKFKADCAGKTVAVVFRYELHGDATMHPKVTTREEPPNLVWIESAPELSARK
ncbi:MAG TPA: hypothetical protein VMH80_22225 [Bryobacteraceae bacterium]|nr:hypothetical protein [Bryobacteraceae bacterium]